MLGFIAPVVGDADDPLTDVAAADAFWRALPRSDPIAAQLAVSGALADLATRRRPNMGRLRALLALDQRARNLVDALLVNYVPGDISAASRENEYWQSAFELCRSFGRAHAHFLRSMRESLLAGACREYLPHVALRLFQHRQIELLLRPFVDELSTRFSWKELHEAYQFAHSCGLARQPLPVSQCHSERKRESTLEREYIHLLLQDLMNGGQFPPHDAFWANQGIPRWCKGMALDTLQVQGAEHRFVVDVDGDAGLARSRHEMAGTCLFLGITPVLASIRDEIAKLRDRPDRVRPGSSLGRARQLKLLRKLDALCAPKRPVIARRGERKPVALTVEVVAGMARIVRALGNKPNNVPVAARPAMPEIEAAPIVAFGGLAKAPADADVGGASTVAQSPPGAADASHPQLTMVDRSDSGCRLHGPAFGANPVAPGTLIALREDSAAPWVLAVVRRVKKRLAGKRIEIGAEYVGSNPRGVIASVVGDPKAGLGATAGSENPRFAALYLRESAEHPVLPIKTLVLPARRFAPEERLTLRSATAVHTVALKEPLEEQGDFIWTPFEIVDQDPAENSVAVEATSGTV
jgi:hypothetical protein